MHRSMNSVTYFYCPQRSCGKLMFSQTCVKSSAHGGGLVTPLLWADTPPPPQTATAADGTHPTRMHSCHNIHVYFSALSSSRPTSGGSSSRPGSSSSRRAPPVPRPGSASGRRTPSTPTKQITLQAVRRVPDRYDLLGMIHTHRAQPISKAQFFFDVYRCSTRTCN